MHRFLSCILCVAIIMTGSPAWAESNNSDSNSSGDSSRSTDQSQDSSKSNSSGDSNTAADDELSTILFLTALGVIAGSSLVGAIWSTHKLSARDKKKAAKDLAAFLQKNHGSVTRDVLVAQGVFWDQWRLEAGLSQEELAEFQTYFSGSKEQSAMIEALNSPLAPKDAVSFAKHMLEAAKVALGSERLNEAMRFSFERSKYVQAKAG